MEHLIFEGLQSTSTTQTVNRPIVDTTTPTHDLSPPSSTSSSSRNSSCSSSLLSLPTESDISSLRKEPEGASPYTIDDKSSLHLRQRQKRPITPPQNSIKPAECFGKIRFSFRFVFFL